MGNRLILFAMVILGLLPFPVQSHARACTTFQLNHEGQIYVGKNYDWMVEDGLIIEKDIIPEPDRFKSIERFIRASKMVQNYKPEGSKSSLDYAFDILKSVSWTANRNWKGTPYSVNTRWSIVYDQTNLCVYFKTHGNRKTRVVFLKSFDFSCKAPVKIFDITSNVSGDVSKHFIEYTQQNNRKLIENAFTKTLFFPKLSTEQLDTLSKYPNTFICGN
jgi:penicillin V acylase-like amidase (Ntn superfamily)